MNGEAMTPGELRTRFGLGHSQFCLRQKRGDFKFLMLSRPIGLARYSRQLVDDYFAGRSTANFGKGSRTARRTA